MSNGSITSREPASEYHSSPGISITRLKELKRSPLHYQYRLTHPRVTKPMTLGTAAHCAVLEPERFDREFAMWDRVTEGRRAAPRSGQHWLGFLAANPGKTIITPKEYGDAMAMRRAVRGDPVAMKYLHTGDPEVSMRWQLDGQDCRGRVDWLTAVDVRPCIVGLKTARDCRPMIFGSAAAKLLYHCQWAFYRDGYEILKNDEPLMVEIVVESEAPHAVVVYIIPEDIILQGREEYTALLQQLDFCERNKLWDGPGQGVEQMLTLPTWAYSQGMDDLAELGIET